MTTVAQRSFAGGEISPSLYARVDIVKYATGLRTCRNFFIKKSGGASSRPGLEYIWEGKYPSKEIRLLPFIFNSAQTYVLEFGDFYLRFVRNGIQVSTIFSGILPWVGATTYAQGAMVSYLGVNYYSKSDANTGNTPNISPTWWYAQQGSIYEIPTPYAELDLSGLNIVQSADVITVVHQNHPVYELSRTGHTSWTLRPMVFSPSIAPPTGLAVSGGAGSTDQWVVTSIKSETFEESVATSPVGSDSKATVSAPRTLTWAAVAGAGEYNVYKNTNGVYGFIGVAGGTSFLDDGIPPDETDTPPKARNPFNAPGDYPGAVGYYQQRLGLARTRNQPEKVWFSKSGQFKNFTTSAPLQDDDAVTFNIAGRRVNAVQNLLDLGNLILLAQDGEWLIQGDTAGILTPGEVNPKQQSYNGSSLLRPILINDNALYVQNRGSIIRDLFATIDATGNTGYKGTDLTVFASHLFENYNFVDWDYSQNPDSIVWMVRDDGTVLGLTYLREHQIWAWHRHDTDGVFERVCVIPEGNFDVPYFVVKRTINGVDKRYIERMVCSSSQFSDIKTYVGMDSSLLYNGINSSNTTMILTGSGWTYQDTLTLTASNPSFSAGDVGNQIWMKETDGNTIRCTIVAYTNPNVVSVKPNKTVPISLRSTATTLWERAVDQLSGLDYLEGKQVSIYANGFVIGNPYNPDCPVFTVVGGQVTLDKPYSYIRVGLPFLCDLQTLDIDTSGSETLADKFKIVNKVTAFVQNSRGIWAGARPPTDDEINALEGLEEYKPRNSEPYDSPASLIPSDQIEITIRSEWNSNGRVFIRQLDPLPLTVLAVMPAGLFPFKGVTQ